MRVKLAFVVLLSALLLAACSNRSSGPEQLQQQAHIRVISGLSDAPSIDVLVDGVALQSGVSSAASDYLKVEAGTRTLTVTVAGDASSVLLRQDLELAADAHYTVIAAGTTARAEAIVVTDTTSATTADMLRVRVVQGAASAGPVDIYVTASDAFNTAVTDGTPTIAGAKFSDVSDFMDLASGVYRIRVTPAGDNATTVYDSGPVTLEAGLNVTVVALNGGDATRPSLRLLMLTADGSSQISDDELCDAFEPNNSFEEAAPITPGTLRAGLCEAGEADFYTFTLNRGRLVSFTVHAQALESELDSVIVLFNEDGVPVDFNDDASADTVDSALSIYLPAGSYFLLVQDFAGRGGEGFFYELTFSAEAPPRAPVFEATAGTFAGDSNSPTIGAFSGNFIALSARNQDGSNLDYNVLVNITALELGTFPFTYFSDSARDGVLAVVIADLAPSSLSLATPAERLAASSKGLETQALEAPRAGILRYAPEGVVLPQVAIGGEVVFAFPSVTITRNVDADALLSVPEVSEARVSNNRRNIRTFFEEAAGASVYRVTAFGRDNAVTGSVTGDGSPLRVRLSGPLNPNEAFVVDVLAGDVGLLEVPLPERQLNLSEYLFYSE